MAFIPDLVAGTDVWMNVLVNHKKVEDLNKLSDADILKRYWRHIRQCSFSNLGQFREKGVWNKIFLFTGILFATERDELNKEQKIWMI